jgi:hypothetical protein
MKNKYRKQLTPNDIGKTGSHQAGIAIPKNQKDLLRFFPALDLRQFNPDVWLECIDEHGDTWRVRYIYYNGKTFTPNRSTRDEYRITHLSEYLKKSCARVGDYLQFTSTERRHTYKIELIRANSQVPKGVIALKGWSMVY